MKRSLHIRATFGALCALAGSAAAQTSLTIYGLVDAGVVTEHGGPAGSVTKMGSGIQSGSRLGFKGMEDLGGGLFAKFALESGFNTDTGAQSQSGLLFGRQAWVGLGGGWGDVTLGRQYTPHYLLLEQTDPFSAGLAGNAANLMSTVQRTDNTIKYTSPDWSGFSGELAYGMGEVPGNSTANQQIGASVGYARGPLMLKIAHQRVDNAIGTDNAKNTLIAGRYDFGRVAASLGVGMNKGLGAVDSRDYMLGVTVPVGAGNILASYIKKDDRSVLNADADQWAIGYTYALSKRTNLYTSYARISNNPGAAYTVGNASDPGTGDKALNFGLRYKF